MMIILIMTLAQHGHLISFNLTLLSISLMRYCIPSSYLLQCIVITPTRLTHLIRSNFQSYASSHLPLSSSPSSHPHFFLSHRLLITATIVSHNVPPYGRAGLYKELSVMKDLIADLRTTFYTPSPSSSPSSSSSSSSTASFDLTPFKSVIPLIADAAEKSGTQLSCTFDI